MTGFVLGAASLNALKGVHPNLQAVCQLAIQESEIDFGVHEGLRTIEQQREYVRTGVSETMDSKHLTQPDGLGHAVDLVPYVGGVLRWEWRPIYTVASAVVRAARDLNVVLTWGAVWDLRSNDLPMSADALKIAVDAYKERHKGHDFIDGPHWQLV